MDGIATTCERLSNWMYVTRKKVTLPVLWTYMEIDRGLMTWPSHRWQRYQPSNTLKNSTMRMSVPLNTLTFRDDAAHLKDSWDRQMCQTENWVEKHLQSSIRGRGLHMAYSDPHSFGKRDLSRLKYQVRHLNDCKWNCTYLRWNLRLGCSLNSGEGCGRSGWSNNYLRCLRIPGPTTPCTGPWGALVRVSAVWQSVSVDNDSAKINQSDTWWNG
jgi:hypothetical protein